ncbi:MAG: hypothetical protein V4506_12490 [Bacteroidota bacterium]
MQGVIPLNTHSWTTGDVLDAAVTITDEPIKNIVNASSTTFIPSVTGKKNANVRINGTHTYSVHNDEKIAETIRVRIRLCTSKGDCINNETGYTLLPNGTLSQSANSYVVASFPACGSFESEGKTIISGATYNESSHRNTITITK